jgi:hypothetical protein
LDDPLKSRYERRCALNRLWGNGPEGAGRSQRNSGMPFRLLESLGVHEYNGDPEWGWPQSDAVWASPLSSGGWESCSRVLRLCRGFFGGVSLPSARIYTRETT